MRGVAVLGSTGSIGRSTLAVLRRLPAQPVAVVAAVAEEAVAVEVCS